jgi:restriction system protein
MEQIAVRTPNLKSLTLGQLQAKYSVDSSRILRYFIDFWHNDLHLHKELRATEIYLLQGKVNALMASWDKKLEALQKRSTIAAGKETADEMTIEALARLEALSGILTHTLKVDDRVDWEALKDRSPYTVDPRFLEPKPLRKTTPEPRYQEISIAFWDILFGRKGRKLAEAKERYETSRRRWQSEEDRNAALFSEQMNEWNARKVHSRPSIPHEDSSSSMSKRREMPKSMPSLAACRLANRSQSWSMQHWCLRSRIMAMFSRNFSRSTTCRMRRRY